MTVPMDSDDEEVSVWRFPLMVLIDKIICCGDLAELSSF